jgi:hypothetical protein
MTENVSIASHRIAAQALDDSLLLSSGLEHSTHALPRRDSRVTIARFVVVPWLICASFVFSTSSELPTVAAVKPATNKANDCVPSGSFIAKSVIIDAFATS